MERKTVMTTRLIVPTMALVLMIGSSHAQTQADRATGSTVATVDVATLAGSARVSKLIGSKVYAGDTSIGQIEDVLLDLNRAAISAVILSVGGFLGMDEKLVGIPPSQIKAGSEAKFTTELTKDDLLDAPAFDVGKLTQP
jgi:sporulation protein YlmC with PRC-barrel domain